MYIGMGQERHAVLLVQDLELLHQVSSSAEHKIGTENGFLNAHYITRLSGDMLHEVIS